MKKGSFAKNSEKHNLSEDSEPDYHQQYVKRFGDTRSLVDINDKYQNYLQAKKRLLHGYHVSDSDSDSNCTQNVQYNKKNKELCECCRKEKHSLNNCPLFTNAVEQQSNMLYTYNTSSSNHFKQLDHFNHYDEVEKMDQHHELRQKAQREYFRKHGTSDDTETCNGIERQHLKLLQKAQEEYYSKRCKYCNEYGHQEDTCTVLEKAALRYPEDNWTDIKAKKSKRSRKNKVLKTEVHDFSETDHIASDCAKETKENYLSKSKYCHYCKQYGHNENICPQVQKSLKKQKGKQITVLPKIHKKDDLSSAAAKVKDFRELETCNICGNSDHKEDDCIEKNQYFKKHGHNFKEQVYLKDMCPLLEEDIRKLENHKLFLNGQTVNNDSNNKIKLKHVRRLNKCNFCGNSGHSESECEEKLQYEYISKYCHYCEEYGHFEDTCPLVEQAAREMENETYCEVSQGSSKQVSFANDVTILSENLVNLKICHICDEFGHNESNCFVKEQAEFYGKFCNHCKENGHTEKDCILNNESSDISIISSNVLKKELEFKTSTAYASICSDHYVCEKCHNVYSRKQDSSKSEGCTPKNVRKSTFQSSFEANAYRLRYCTLCGIEGLIDTCILKERAATA